MKGLTQMDIQIEINKANSSTCAVISSIKNESPEIGPLPRWRKWIMPIYDHELIRLIPLNIMMFCALFSYSCFRDCKDSIVKLSLSIFVC